MRTSTLRPASYPARRRAPWAVSLDAAVVVILLAALFAGAVLAALQPHPPVDARQAAVEGGL